MEDKVTRKFETQNGNIKGTQVQKMLLKVHLKKQLYTLKMEEEDNVKGHVNKLRECVFELLRVDVKM